MEIFAKCFMVIILILYLCATDEGNTDETAKHSDEEDDLKEKDKEAPAKAMNALENGLKAISTVKTAADIEKERKKRLLGICVDGFLFAIQKRNRLQDPKNPRHRWFRWKDR